MSGEYRTCCRRTIWIEKPLHMGRFYQSGAYINQAIYIYIYICFIKSPSFLELKPEWRILWATLQDELRCSTETDGRPAAGYDRRDRVADVEQDTGGATFESGQRFRRSHLTRIVYSTSQANRRSTPQPDQLKLCCFKTLHLNRKHSRRTTKPQDNQRLHSTSRLSGPPKQGMARKYDIVLPALGTALAHSRCPQARPMRTASHRPPMKLKMPATQDRTRVEMVRGQAEKRIQAVEKFGNDQALVGKLLGDAHKLYVECASCCSLSNKVLTHHQIAHVSLRC